MNLRFIHIGKCGGATIRDALAKSDQLDNFSSIEEVHINQPVYRENCKYLICIRNPITRSISAFNWHFHLVVETEKQRYRFMDEYKILDKYGSLNDLSELLYQNEKLNEEVANEFKKIHHLKEDISFYLKPILKNINKSDIFGILLQPTLNSDIKRVLNVSHFTSRHIHSSRVDPKKLNLSANSERNLKKFLIEEYRSIVDLYSIGCLSKKQLLLLL